MCGEMYNERIICCADMFRGRNPSTRLANTVVASVEYGHASDLVALVFLWCGLKWSCAKI